MRSLPDPSLAAFYPEIKKTISHIRRARHRLASEGGEGISANSPILSEVESEASFEEETNSSPTKSIDASSLDLGADTMAAPRRITLKEAGALDFTLQPFQARHPNLTVDFELKTALINLLPEFHGLPAQEPIKHLRDFQIACSTTRRHGTDETAIWLYALPFSLEGKAKEWFYTQPEAVVTNWDLLRREFLDKFFPPEFTDRLRKEISCVTEGESKTLYGYWERFRNLLDSCLTIRFSASKEFHKSNHVVSIVSKPTENPFVQKFGCHK
ncbi:hypothetical protein AHAS_Ahas16G0178600 [Arachis hypogaea]